MRIGIRGHDIYDGKTRPQGIADTLKNAGFDAVQLVCHKSIQGVEYARGQLTREKAAEIGEAFDKNIHIALLGAYFNPVHPSKSIIETGIQVFKDNIENARVIGAAVVASETGSYQGDPWVYHPQNRTSEAYERVTGVFSGLAAYAEEYGVNVGIEGAAGHVCHDVKTLKRVIDGINSDNVRVVFDYFNFMEDSRRDYLAIIEEGLETFGNIHCFHIKDCDGSLNQCPVGRGIVDFERVLPLIKNYDGGAVLILEGTPADDAARAAGFLRELWDSI
jgi:sugar phosphate isomerase/epimerase